jgi:hypothetical protein
MRSSFADYRNLSEVGVRTRDLGEQRHGDAAEEVAEEGKQREIAGDVEAA